MNSYIYMSPNYCIVTPVPSVGDASPYITISSTLTIMEVIFVAYLAVLAVPKVATSPHWLGGLDNARPASHPHYITHKQEGQHTQMLITNHWELGFNVPSGVPISLLINP